MKEKLLVPQLHRGSYTEWKHLGRIALGEVFFSPPGVNIQCNAFIDNMLSEQVESNNPELTDTTVFYLRSHISIVYNTNL